LFVKGFLGIEVGKLGNKGNYVGIILESPLQ